VLTPAKGTRPKVVSITNLSWQAPLEGFVKVNWDAAVDKDHRKMGNEAIIRDYQGEVLATLSVSKDYITDLVIAEATATWRAALFCRELRHQWVEFEGDALQMVQALRKEDCNWSKYGHIIEEIHGVLNDLH
jgi:hypothetical protein